MNLLNFFAPEICCICGEITDSGFDLQKTLFNSGKNKIESPFCPHCTHRMEKSFCKARRKIPGTDCIAIYLFDFSDETVQRAIYQLKTHNFAAIREFFARLTGEVMKDMLTGEKNNFVLTNIPRSISLYDKYGFDQSEEVVRTFVRLNNSFEYKKIFVRDKKYRAPQRSLGAKERLVNARRSLQLLATQVPKRVLVLDDMITTGATAMVATELLTGAGCEKAMFLFIAGKENNKERRNENE